MPANSADRLSDYIERVRQLAPLIREHAAESEQRAQLSPRIVEALHNAGLFRILLPTQMRGGGLTLPEAFRIFEEIAGVDGSTGWNLAICGAGQILGNFIARNEFETIFNDPRVVVAGSLNPMGNRAVECDGGFRFNGTATYSSGCAQASWLFVAGLVVRDGKPQFIDNMPVTRAGLFPVNQCRILNTWSVSGLRGTGSHDCAIDDIFIPASRTFEWPDPRPAWDTGTLGRIPLMVQLGGNLAAVALGIARNAIDTLKELALTKVPLTSTLSLRERPVSQTQLAQAEGWLQAGRAYLYQYVNDIWTRGEARADFDLATRAASRLATVTAGRLAAQAVDLVHDAAGITSIKTSSPIERCWRDIHALTQHVLMNTGRYEVIGRVMLGLPPNSII